MKNIIFLFLLLTGTISSTDLFAGWDEGVAAFVKKDYQSATKEFEKHVKDNPGDYRGHYMLGLSLENRGSQKAALNHLRKAYDLNPNDLSVKVALGRAYYINNKSNKAIQTLKDAVKKSKNNAEAHMYLGLAYLEGKRPKKEEALHHLRKAYDLNPNDLFVKILVEVHGVIVNPEIDLRGVNKR